MIDRIKNFFLLVFLTPIFAVFFSFVFILYTYANKKDIKRLKEDDSYKEKLNKGVL